MYMYLQITKNRIFRCYSQSSKHLTFQPSNRFEHEQDTFKLFKSSRNGPGTVSELKPKRGENSLPPGSVAGCHFKNLRGIHRTLGRLHLRWHLVNLYIPAVFKRPERTFFPHAPTLVGASGSKLSGSGKSMTTLSWNSSCWRFHVS